MPQKPVSPKPPVCGCKKKKCCKKDCCENEFAFRKVVIPAALGDDVTGKAKPSNGAYTNSYVEYEAGGAQYMYDSYGVYTKIEPGSEGTLDFNELENRPRYAGIEMTNETDIPDFSDSITALQGSISDEQEARISADSGLQTQIDALSAASDVTDIVGTYAELEAYDTSKLKDNDIIKVLQDETHDDETTYYRWNTTTEEFSLIGEEGPYYTKAAADQKFQDKLTAGDGVTIDSDNVISADGETIFYANLSETGSTRHIYKDINFTSAASAQDVIDANDKGQVILRGTSLANPTAYSDSYLQNAFIMPHNNDYEFVFLDRDLRYEYTASATTDTAFYYDTSEIQPKLTAGSNVQITGTTISATDTTYSNFTGTDGVDAGTAGLVPAPATTDAGKYLKADGTWDSVQAGPAVVQTTGTSQTDVMSQDAVSKELFGMYGTSFYARYRVKLGYQAATSTASQLTSMTALGGGATATGSGSIAISSSSGANAAVASGINSIAVGYNSVTASGADSIAIGGATSATYSNSVALGSGAKTGRTNEVSVGRGSASGSGPATRVIANVTDPTNAQDAATKNYVDNAVAGAGATVLTPVEYTNLWENA